MWFGILLIVTAKTRGSRKIPLSPRTARGPPSSITLHLSLPLLLTLLTTPALAQSHQRTLVEPLPPQVLLQGHAPSAAVRIWKLGCVAGDDSVDDATFQQVIADARALEQANAASNHLQLLPQSGSSALTNFDLAFTVSSPPPGAAAAVTACEQYYESLLGSLHATGPVAIWGLTCANRAKAAGHPGANAAFIFNIVALVIWVMLFVVRIGSLR